jgi:peroxiredoxin family protein
MSETPQMQEQLDALRKELARVKGAGQEDKLSMVLFSGDLDKALAAFIIATGAVAMGMESVIFLTFWGTPLFRKADKSVAGKDLMGKMFGWMLPKGARKATLSKMNMGGMGTVMLKDLMKKKNVASLEQMIDMAGQLGVRVYVCEMSMDLMGFKREEMIDYPDLKYAGVATFLAEAKNSKVQLFL